MDLESAKVTIGWHEARETIRQYGAILKEKRTKEDHAIFRSTKAIVAGKMVIRLAEAVRLGGVDARGLPKIAVTRADDKFAHCESRGTRCDMSGMKDRSDSPKSWGKRDTFQARLELVKPRAFEFKLGGKFQDACGAVAVVPTIPPAFRPPPTSRENYYVLFEAVWEPVPPVDPALLAPLGCGLYAVVAVWNLTTVERAVLADANGLRS